MGAATPPPSGHAVVQEHFALLWRFFHRRADDEADDLIQQTLVQYIDVARRVEIRYPRAYLLRVARSVLHAHLHGRVPCAPPSRSLADVQTSLPTRLDRRSEHEALRAALHQLPRPLYEVVELYYSEGLRGAELAVALGVPEGTIRSRLRRAKAKLRALRERPQSQ